MFSRCVNFRGCLLYCVSILAFVYYYIYGAESRVMDRSGAASILYKRGYILRLSDTFEDLWDFLEKGEFSRMMGSFVD